jgi:hypothetical protein
MNFCMRIILGSTRTNLHNPVEATAAERSVLEAAGTAARAVVGVGLAVVLFEVVVAGANLAVGETRAPDSTRYKCQYTVIGQRVEVSYRQTIKSGQSRVSD